VTNVPGLDLSAASTSGHLPHGERSAVERGGPQLPHPRSDNIYLADASVHVTTAGLIPR